MAVVVYGWIVGGVPILLAAWLEIVQLACMSAPFRSGLRVSQVALHFALSAIGWGSFVTIKALCFLALTAFFGRLTRVFRGRFWLTPILIGIGVFINTSDPFALGGVLYPILFFTGGDGDAALLIFRILLALSFAVFWSAYWYFRGDVSATRIFTRRRGALILMAVFAAATLGLTLSYRDALRNYETAAELARVGLNQRVGAAFVLEFPSAEDSFVGGPCWVFRYYGANGDSITGRAFVDVRENRIHTYRGLDPLPIYGVLP